MAGRATVASHGASLRNPRSAVGSRCSMQGQAGHGAVLRKFSTRKPVELGSDMTTREADRWARRADQLPSALCRKPRAG